MANERRWSDSDTVQVAQGVFRVARELNDRIDERGITVEFLDAADALVLSVLDASSGQAVRLGTQKGATLRLEDLLHLAARRTAVVRNAIVRRHPDNRQLHKDFGVGGPSASTSVKNALSAIDAAVGGAAKHPDEAAAARIVERDIVGLRDLRAAILQADTTQEGAKSGKKSGTVARNALLANLTEKIDDVLNAAELEFVDEPETLKRFTDPLPTKTKKDEAPENPPGPAS